MKNHIDCELRIMQLLYVHKKSANDKIPLKIIADESNIKYYIWLKHNKELQEYAISRECMYIKVNQKRLEECSQYKDIEKVKETIADFAGNINNLYKYLNDSMDVVNVNAKLKENNKELIETNIMLKKQLNAYKNRILKYRKSENDGWK